MFHSSYKMGGGDGVWDLFTFVVTSEAPGGSTSAADLVRLRFRSSNAPATDPAPSPGVKLSIF